MVPNVAGSNPVIRPIVANRLNFAFLKVENIITNIFSKRYFCPVCGKLAGFDNMINDVEIRKHAICPGCGALERHRFIYFIYKLLFLDTTRKIKILHIAPEMVFYNLISKNENIDYHSMDLYPETYGYAKNIVKGDITNIPFEDDSFDFVIHNQVLEHIKDEELCIKECLRVLKKGGIFIINIPYSPTRENNYEDDTIISPEQRKVAYYQSDHVRLYGKECLDKYTKKFNLYRISPDIFGPNVMKHLKTKRDSTFLQDAYYLLKK